MTRATRAKRDLLSGFTRTFGGIVDPRAAEPIVDNAGRGDMSIATSDERSAWIVTAGGERFSVRQIGSMFGTE